MSFKKAGDYLFRIFSEEEEGKDFHLFFSSDKIGFAGGFLNDSENTSEDTNRGTYSLIKNGNMCGLKIGNGKYIFLQSRMPFVQVPKFQDIFEDDEIGQEQFREDFKDVQYVEVFESDKENNSTRKISYLINKSTQLLLEYYHIDQNYDNIDCDLNEEYLNLSYLYMLKVHKPSNPSFDIMKSEKTLLIIPDNYHILFDMHDNGKTIQNPLFRQNIVKKVYSEILLAERASLFFQKDFKDCFSSIETTINNKFGKNSEGGR